MDSERINQQGSSSATATTPTAEPTAPLTVLLDPAALDQLLDRISELKATQKLLEAQLEPLLDQLDAAFEEGLLDPSFSHNDVSFCWSAGRTTYVYPEALKQREQALKAAQKDSIASGAATAKSGKPFWTIRLPRE
jgi:hypothetical protein